MPRSLFGVLLIAFFLVSCSSPPSVSEAPTKSRFVKVADSSQGKVDFGGAKYVGSKVCANCHKTAVERYQRTLMGRTMNAPARPGLQRVDCESCHGPASAHVAAGGGRGKGIPVTFRNAAEPAEAQNAVCLNCHSKGEQRYWYTSAHNSRDVACVSCHTIMKKVSDRFQLAKINQNETCAQCHLVRRAQSFRNSHMDARGQGDTQCSNCHNPHGSSGEKLLRANSVNDLCYKCHPEKRGPFLWEHAPVRDSCTNCHEPHGTLNDNLLKIRRPRLCNSCHVEGRHPGTPQLAQSRYTFNASCLNCHSQIHGSNHPSGNFFLR